MKAVPLPGEEMPALVETLTSTAPALAAGLIAVMLVAELTVKSAAASVPKNT